MAVAPWIVSDELWESVEPLTEGGAALPLSGPQASAGSAGAAGDLVRVADGDLVDGLAARARLRLGVTSWRRFDEWQKAGVWEELHALLLVQLRSGR